MPVYRGFHLPGRRNFSRDSIVSGRVLLYQDSNNSGPGRSRGIRLKAAGTSLTFSRGATGLLLNLPNHVRRWRKGSRQNQLHRKQRREKEGAGSGKEGRGSWQGKNNGDGVAGEGEEVEELLGRSSNGLDLLFSGVNHCRYDD